MMVNKQNPSSLNITTNYTYQDYDLINHRNSHQYVPKLQHSDFSHRISQANLKGIITKHIDKARLNAPNYHENYE